MYFGNPVRPNRRYLTIEAQIPFTSRGECVSAHELIGGKKNTPSKQPLVSGIRGKWGCTHPGGRVRRE